MSKTRSDIGEKYFVIMSDMEIESVIEASDKHDTYYYKIGNYFSSYDEARVYRDKIVELLKERENE